LYRCEKHSTGSLKMTVNSEICFICCASGADSRDHIIPASLFVPPLPCDLLTLPAHYRCHNQLQEEYFRNIVAWLGLENSNTANILWEGKVARSLQRSRPLRDSIRSSLLRRINLVSPSGIWLGTAPGIQIDRDRFYPTLEKIVRGLYRHHLGRHLPTDATFIWAINEPLQGESRKIFQRCKPGIAYIDVFECRYGIASDDNIEMTIWWLRFYKKLVMRCSTRIDLTDIS